MSSFKLVLAYALFLLFVLTFLAYLDSHAEYIFMQICVQKKEDCKVLLSKNKYEDL